MKFTVESVRRVNDHSFKIEFTHRDADTAYTSLLFLYIAAEDAHNYNIGDTFDLCLPFSEKDAVPA